MTYRQSGFLQVLALAATARALAGVLAFCRVTMTQTYLLVIRSRRA